LYNQRMNRRSALTLLSATVAKGFAKNDRVVIAGAGIIGASIAYHLVKRGANVTILEKQRPGAGATEKSFAWINSFSKQPRSYYDLNLYGIAGWRRLSLEFADLEIQWGGSVQWTTGDEGEGMRKTLARLEQWGYAAHLVEEQEISKLLPAVVSGPVGAACFAEQEGTIDPMQALRTLLKNAQKLGAKVEYPCAVTGISVANGRVSAVQTTRGTVETDFLVLAAGVGTPALARLVQVNVPLKESPGVLAHSAPVGRILDRLAFGPGANIKQNPDGRIVTGTDFGPAATIDASQEAGEKLLERARRFLPGLKDARLETVTLGYRVLPKDDHPIVGFVDAWPNLYLAAMHSGITLSPLIGQVAAAEILDGISVDLLRDYRPSRFA
jgi:glycine/D-amino acid oxidase-like deaminating enzyme